MSTTGILVQTRRSRAQHQLRIGIENGIGLGSIGIGNGDAVKRRINVHNPTFV